MGTRWLLATLGLLATLALLPLGALAAHAELRLREVAAEWGVDFRHHSGASGRRYMPETMVGGLVVFDYDLDGDEDLLFVDGGGLPGYQGEPPGTRLFRNDGARFLDVTARSGIAVTGYGVGAAAADVEGDGDLDVYITTVGIDQLFRNDGNGSFTDVSPAAGIVETQWSSGAAFADADRDGDLDLYVARYVDFTVATHRGCRDRATGTIDGYCQPDAYPALGDRYFRNRGDGTFAEHTAAAGLDVRPMAGLGVVFTDLDGDGWPDLYVANDTHPNFLFHNLGAGRFEEIGALAGVALSPGGSGEAGMGVDADDYDGDGLVDLVVTNFELETTAMYRNLGDLLFHDSRFLAGVAEPSLPYLGFGVDLADLDHDGDLDLVTANGHVNDTAPLMRQGAQFAQRNQLFANLGGGRFRECVDCGLDLVRVSRGLATGDLDGDGDLEVVILDVDDLAEIYENVAGSTSGSWLQVSLALAGGNPFGIGARIEANVAGRRQLREVRAGGSYLSQNALAAHFGLGGASRVERLRLALPDGRRRVLLDAPAGRVLRILD